MPIATDRGAVSRTGVGGLAATARAIAAGGLRPTVVVARGFYVRLRSRRTGTIGLPLARRERPFDGTVERVTAVLGITALAPVPRPGAGPIPRTIVDFEYLAVFILGRRGQFRWAGQDTHARRVGTRVAAEEARLAIAIFLTLLFVRQQTITTHGVAVGLTGVGAFSFLDAQTIAAVHLTGAVVAYVARAALVRQRGTDLLKLCGLLAGAAKSG
jgi:hypothetical protein